MFGVCQLTSNFNVTDADIYTKISYGTFSSWNNVHVGKKEGHSKQSNSMKDYKGNNIIEIEYERETNIAKIKNVTDKTESVSVILIDNTLPLYFTVLLRNEND